MKEVTFIRQNLEKWRSYETVAESPALSTPDEMADAYIKCNSDFYICLSSIRGYSRRRGVSGTEKQQNRRNHQQNTCGVFLTHRYDKGRSREDRQRLGRGRLRDHCGAALYVRRFELQRQRQPRHQGAKRQKRSPRARR